MFSCHYRFLDQLLDLQDVLDETIQASYKWFNLGLALGLSHNDLSALSDKHRGDCNVCLREMLARRLQSSQQLTWEMVCSALRQTTVDRYDVAEKIEEKYL